MNILLAYNSLYSTIGGGQSVMRNLIAANPDKTFYYFGAPEANAPSNANALQVSDHHRSIANRFDVESVSVPRPELSLAGKQHDIAMMFDMADAAAKRALHFDVLEIPDFEPLIGLFPFILRAHGVHVGRVVLGLHGTLTSSISHLWNGPNRSKLDTLLAYEKLTYRAADCRYGISNAYVQKMAAKEGITGNVIDPLYAIDSKSVSWGQALPSTPGEVVAQGGKLHKPALNFVGRQDYIKGPDIFLFLISNMPHDIYSKINIFGHSVVNDDVSSRDVLERVAKLRGLKIAEMGPVPPTRLHDIYSNDRSITFATSRVDTFNLVAFESLLNGCPTVISANCGICEYLDRVWPDLPYVKVDIDDIWPSVPELIDLATRYDYWRDRVQASLATGPRIPVAGDVPLYGWDMFNDMTAVSELHDIAEEVIKLLNSYCQKEYLPAKIEEVGIVAASHAYGHSTPNLSWMFKGAMSSSYAIKQMEKPSNSELYDPNYVENKILELTNIVQDRRSQRINAFKLMADIELSRGNDLLYVVYQTRRFRLGRRFDSRSLDQCIDILRSNNLHDDAAALNLLHRGRPDEVFDYLKAQPALCVPPSDKGIEFVEHFNRRENPRVAVLVSVYNAESKVAQFVQGMRSFLAETVASLEVIFVDSGSPDQSSAALRRELMRVTPGLALDATIMRTVNRETIQAAWNRALMLVRAPYITFLGADEMMRPDSLKILSEILDRRSDIDWVQGSGVVCEVNEHGTPIKDVMLYNRQMNNKYMHYLDCCYMGWVGGLYRRKVHERVGYYNPKFRAAGDNEFKNRALPSMQVMSIPDVLGTFRNFPEERTTQSPIAEIEDLRAWHLPRSVGGMRYAFEGRNPEEAVALFNQCFSYRKSYMEQNCTDIELAMSVAGYLEQYEPGQFNDIQTVVPALLKAANAYRQLDEMMNFRPTTGLVTVAKLGAIAKDAALRIAQAEREVRTVNAGCSLEVINDNKYHQFQNIWHSQAKVFTVDRMLDFDDMAGPQDLAELLSSCQSADDSVDFERAWATNRVDQLHRLFKEATLDLCIPSTGPTASEAIADAVHALMSAVTTSNDHSASILVAGPATRDRIPAHHRVYHLGAAATLRPVLAACRLIALPYWRAADIDACLSTAVNLLVSGKPLLVSEPLYVRLSAILGDLSGAVREQSLIVCHSPSDLPARVEEYLAESPAQQVGRRQRALHWARHFRTGHKAIRIAQPDLEDNIRQDDDTASVPLAWNETTKRFGRALHSLTEAKDKSELRDLLTEAKLHPAEWRKLVSMSKCIFSTKSASALKTNQPVFQILRAMPALDFDDNPMTLIDRL